MFGSLKLGKICGIDLYVHGTFWLLPLVVLFGGMSSGLDAVAGELAFLFAVFGCVVLHEVGHALAARAYGIGTRDITLYPVGGMASLERMPEKPGQEIGIALAGPAVNVVIAAALFLGLLGGAAVMPWGVSGANEAVQFAVKVLWANVVLAVFNLLPAFPMDGGRVLRALLATRMPRPRATAVAVGVGSVVAGAMGVAGVLLPHFGLVAVAVMVYLLGQAELAGARAEAAARHLREQVGGWFGRSADGTGPVGRDFTGLVWDAGRRLWVQYENGHVVRVIDPDA